jgi:large subunit ribosomal protein L25
MEKIELKATRRPADKSVQAIRADGLVPAELYGHGVENQHLALSLNEFEKVLRKAGESTIVTLNVDGLGVRNVLIHDVQRHPVKNEPIHIDFYEVSMTEKLKTNVQLEFVGEPAAVKALGGTLVKMLTEVEVEALPADLPHSLTIDISGLNTFEDILEVKDIQLPKGVVITAGADEAVAKVQPPRDMEAELATPVEEDVTKVEGVVKEEPAAEGEGEGEKKSE